MREVAEIQKDKRVSIGLIKTFPGGLLMMQGTVKLTGQAGRKTYNLIFTVEPGEDRKPYMEHASITPIVGSRLAGWEEMSELKDILWKDEEQCYQIFPKKSQYVNLKEDCLHIWRNLRGEEVG